MKRIEPSIPRVAPVKQKAKAETVTLRHLATALSEAHGVKKSEMNAMLMEMVETIAYHHRPEAESCGAVLPAILALSNDLCKRLGIGLERPLENGSPVEHWSAGRLGLDAAACAEIQEIVRTALEEEKRLYAM